MAFKGERFHDSLPFADSSTQDMNFWRQRLGKEHQRIATPSSFGGDSLSNLPCNPYNNSAGDGWMRTQLERDCSRGRLIGGIVGGGLGYVASRDNGRSWAVPLGALLGSQVGCNAGSGRRPLPW